MLQTLSGKHTVRKRLTKRLTAVILPFGGCMTAAFPFCGIRGALSFTSAFIKRGECRIGAAPSAPVSEADREAQRLRRWAGRASRGRGGGVAEIRNQKSFPSFSAFRPYPIYICISAEHKATDYIHIMSKKYAK